MEIGGYEDFEVIGSGGNAHVYRATHSHSGDTVAVKVLRGGGDDSVTRRFERERSLMASLETITNVVPVHESGFDANGDPYLVMPLYTGGSLQDRVDEGPMPWREAVELTKTMAESIALAHAKRILHLDIKPANVLLDDAGMPWLADFGISEMMGHTASMSAKMMTPAFTPPERLDGAKPSEQTDVYGIMATLFALLTGRPPYVNPEMTGPMSVMMAIMRTPLPLNQLPEGTPLNVRNALLRGMAKSPDDRPRSAIELVGLLEDVLDGREIAAPAPITTPLAESPTAETKAPDTDVAVDPEPVPHQGTELVPKPLAAAVAGVGTDSIPVPDRRAPSAITLADPRAASLVAADDDDSSRAKVLLLSALAIMLLLGGGVAAAYAFSGDRGDTEQVTSSGTTELVSEQAEGVAQPDVDVEISATSIVASPDAQVLGVVVEGEGGEDEPAEESSSSTTSTTSSTSTTEPDESTSTTSTTSTTTTTTTTTQAPPAKPNASFGASSTAVSEGSTVRFTDSSTGDITSYAWTFGDGTTSTLTNPSKRYDEEGTYTVRLAVNGPGGTDTKSTTISVTRESVEPTASFSASATTVDVDESVSFNSTSTGDVSSVSWNMGDGTTKTGSSVTHKYSRAGSFTVRMTAKGPAGEDSATRTITVNEKVTAPNANFTASATTVEVGTRVNFQSTSSGDVDSLAWNFGNGSTDSGPSTSHTYTTVGTFTVTLTANGPGGTDTATKRITVTKVAAPPLEAGFVAKGGPTGSEQTVSFDNITKGDAVSYSWDFGDGSSSTDKEPSHTYATPNTYSVTLTATDADGKTDSATHSVRVDKNSIKFEAGWTASAEPSPDQQTLNFTSTTIGPVTTLSWDFGDGSSGTGANVSHTYAAPGRYTVTLTATGPEGTDTATHPVRVDANA